MKFIETVAVALAIAITDVLNATSACIWSQILIVIWRFFAQLTFFLFSKIQNTIIYWQLSQWTSSWRLQKLNPLLLTILILTLLVTNLLKLVIPIITIFLWPILHVFKLWLRIKSAITFLITFYISHVVKVLLQLILYFLIVILIDIN